MTIRLALLGLGEAAWQIDLPACRRLPALQIVGACDPDPDRRARARSRLGDTPLYVDPNELLSREKPDLVIIATPPDTHHALCLLALEHGSHVFCEKPFVRHVHEADAVIESAEQRGLMVVVNNQYPLMRIYRVARERLHRGDFGRPFLIQVWQQLFHPPSREANWRQRLVESTWYEFGTHPIDLVCTFFDTLPVAVTAHMPRPHPTIAADVLVQATLRFPGDRLATFVLNRTSHALARYLEMRIDCERASLRLSFGGVARASLDWSRALGRPIARLSPGKGGEARVEAGGHSRILARAWREDRVEATALRLQGLVDAIGGGTVSNAAARHARELIRIVAAGYESARTGETVWLGAK